MTEKNLDIHPDWNALAHFEPDFHGAMLVSADGTETPITEKMVQSAFDSLIQDWNSGHGGLKVRHKELNDRDQNGLSRTTQNVRPTAFV